MPWVIGLGALLVTLGTGAMYFKVATKRWRARYQDRPDGALLATEQLIPDQSYQFEFALLFPDEDLANRAATRLRAQGYEVDIGTIGGDLPWACSARRWMFPAEAELAQIRVSMTSIATELRGSYDDWIALSASEVAHPTG